MMVNLLVSVATMITVASLTIAGCAQAPPAPPKAPPPPTAAPAATTKAAEPTKAPPATSAPVVQPTATPARKVEYPVKGRAITLIVPSPPGGGMDISARLLAPELERDLGTPVEVVNKPGASMQVAATELVRSKPDGHTLGFVNVQTFTMTYLDQSRKAIYTRKDFQPVALYLSSPVSMVVKADSPFKGVKDVVDAAKARPGQVKVATANLLGSTHLGFVALEKAAGIQFGFVHFDGGAPATTALLGGHVEVAAQNAEAVMMQVKSGAIRMLGIMDREESPFYPGVKTFDSQGYKVYQTTSFGVAAPAGTPKEIVDLLDGSIKKALQDNQVKKKFDEMGQIVTYMNSAQLEAYWAESEPVMKQLLEAAMQEAKP